MSPVEGPHVLRLGGGQVLLRGPALQIISQLAALGARHWYAVDGGTASASVRALLDDLAAESTQHVRSEVRTDVRSTPAASRSDAWITTAEAADQLGCTSRHVRRIATSLGARRVGSSWRYDPAQVAAYHLDRQPAGEPTDRSTTP